MGGPGLDNWLDVGTELGAWVRGDNPALSSGPGPEEA